MAPVLYDAVLKVLIHTVSKDQKTQELHRIKTILKPEDIELLKAYSQVSFNDLEPQLDELYMDLDRIRSEAQYLHGELIQGKDQIKNKPYTQMLDSFEQVAAAWTDEL